MLAGTLYTDRESHGLARAAIMVAVSVAELKEERAARCGLARVLDVEICESGAHGDATPDVVGERRNGVDLGVVGRRVRGRSRSRGLAHALQRRGDARARDEVERVVGDGVLHENAVRVHAYRSHGERVEGDGAHMVSKDAQNERDGADGSRVVHED